MATAQPLLQAFSQQLSGAGAGTIRLGPVPSFQQWSIRIYTVQTTGGTGTLQALVQVYRNLVTAGALIDGSYAGNLDTSAQDPPIILATGESLFFVWSGANPNSIATLRVEGTVYETASFGPDYSNVQ
jgi:hypothetical protein